MKKFILTSLAATLWSMPMAMGAIPDQISHPGQGTSPGTGQTQPGHVPKPNGHTGVFHHPNANVSNYPPQNWFVQSFYPEYLSLNKATANLATWANYNGQGWIGYYANWLSSVLNNYRGYVFSPQGYPIHYPAWNYYATRGDLLHLNYYWIRPLYFQILREGQNYLMSSHPASPGRQQYLYYIQDLVRKYHRFVICLHGRNGEDPQAQDDTEAFELEEMAGAF